MIIETESEPVKPKRKSKQTFRNTEEEKMTWAE